ncbi:MULTISPECIES: lysyl oxidase family protein [unclassified Streptomyces]|uniref:lysyl oxidase family protein n=1 Tax=unclassified Streptomyces TaxID=2593676 RepID=UPI003D73E58A
MTSQQHRRGARRAAFATGAALAVVAVTGAAPGVGAAPTSKPSKPQLKLIAATQSVTLDRWSGEPGVYLDLGTYLTVDGAPLEFRVTRASYKDPVVARQILRDGRRTTSRTLPAGLVKDFKGLPGFLQVSVTDAAGKEVVKTAGTFCPNNAAGRLRPDAPATSHYPESCPENPFTLGSVWGVEKGWAARTGTVDYENPVDLPAGEYTAKVSVAKKYRDLFGIPDDRPTIKVTVRDVGDGDTGGGSEEGGTAPLRSAARADHGDASHGAPRAAARRPSGPARVPANTPRPDLRSLPAWGIAITDGEDGDAPGRDYLAFSATVWNAGPSPLVVDGFRKPGQDLMDAYQYFYDGKGKQVGYTPTGTMEWDARDGHEHWHFTDFAVYRLLSEDRTKEVRSGKEAFCLANTDAVDYTVKNANWRPYNTDLSTACGEQNTISVREVLDVGSGDTYSQYRPGQSFDITDLPNGTYYIQVTANPEKRLHEANLKNNVSLRKVVLGGTPGARTVQVPPYDLVDAP